MRELFAPIKRVLWFTFWAAILAFPVLGIVQWISPKTVTPFTSYLHFWSHAWVYIYTWGDWAIVATFTLLFVFSAKPYYVAAERIRHKRFIQEYKRWADTPYISPVHLFYLVTPQDSYSPYLTDLAQNLFYHDVVEMFRNRVFVNAAFTKEEPKRRPYGLQVIGFQLIMMALFGLALLVGLLYLVSHDREPAVWFAGWYKFSIPFIAFLLSWMGQLLYAMGTVGSGKALYQSMGTYFQAAEPKIYWRDVFPDRPYGEAILNAWGMFRERKQRYFYQLRNQPVPPEEYFNYDNPAIASYPYPTEKIPEWADAMEDSVQSTIGLWKENKIQEGREAIKKSKGKVVELRKRKF